MAAKRLLEVESKFLFNPSLVAVLQSNGGNPAFKRLEALKTHTFTDTYYDHRDILSKNGIWLRQRTTDASMMLEAKVRISGDFSRSTFDEITDWKDITAAIRPHLPEFSTKKKGFGLDLLAEYTTTRREFRADDKFAVVLDYIDFGHSVGEVELMSEDEKEAHREIDRFMARYPWFFMKGKAEGKLEAYFRVKSTDHST
ncbi:MAG: hypothetical protein L6R38_006453 [Xanthoria sp. 2 TBL-2021]|nr:MAG: hypothetical protein L6R38_006453 [Xanthoria sp. 2 TBL-2021]